MNRESRSRETHTETASRLKKLSREFFHERDLKNIGQGLRDSRDPENTGTSRLPSNNS